MMKSNLYKELINNLESTKDTYLYDLNYYKSREKGSGIMDKIIIEGTMTEGLTAELLITLIWDLAKPLLEVRRCYNLTSV